MTEKDARDPVAWERPEQETALFVNLPRVQTKIALDLRGVYGTGMINLMWKQSNEEWWPNRFPLGKMALGSSTGDGGFTAQRPESWIFSGTGLQKEN